MGPHDGINTDVHIGPDMPLEMRERLAQEMLDGMIEWLEGCYREHPIDAVILATLHIGEDGSQAVQSFMGGEIPHYLRILGQIGQDVAQQMQRAWERGEVTLTPWEPPQPE